MKDLSPKPGDLDPIETASRDEIAGLQLQRMKKSLAHAYNNVKHYKDAFDAAGVHPDDLADLSDLAKFPFTVKQDLRNNYPFGMFAVPREQVNRIHASSGTTGQPTVVGYTENDLRMWEEVMGDPCVPLVCAVAMCCITRMVMGCSRVAWVCMAEPRRWA